MLNQLFEDNSKMRYKMYVDYDNLYGSIQETFGRTVQDISFFAGIKKEFEENAKLAEIECYANFSSETFSEKREQMWLEQQGIKTISCTTSNKNSTDLKLTIQAVSDLYEKSHIDIFVIVTNDRDFVPLIQQIRSKDKMVVLVCSKHGVNSILPNSADHVLFIDDLFKVEERKKIDVQIIEEAKHIIYDKKDKEDALYIYRFMLRSGIFKGFLVGKNLMSTNGISTHCARNSDFSKNEVIWLLMVCAKEGYFKFVEKDGDIVMEDFKMDAIYQK